jgi:hypothetical protein
MKGGWGGTAQIFWPLSAMPMHFEIPPQSASDTHTTAQRGSPFTARQSLLGLPLLCVQSAFVEQTGAPQTPFEHVQLLGY